MADVEAIRRGIAANLAAVLQTAAAQEFQMQVSAYMNPQSTPPTIEVYPDKTIYDELISTDELRFKVRALVGFNFAIGAQQLLDRYLGTEGELSVKALIEADPRLTDRLEDDGSIQAQEPAADDLRVEDSTGSRLYPIEGRGHALGCEWTVCVHATR